MKPRSIDEAEVGAPCGLDSSRSSLDSCVGPFSREGWITRDGKFLPCCRQWMHGQVAYLALGGRNAEYRAERMGWVRISLYDETCSRDLSQKQINTFWDWAEKMGFERDDVLETLRVLCAA